MMNNLTEDFLNAQTKSQLVNLVFYLKNALRKEKDSKNNNNNENNNNNNNNNNNKNNNKNNNNNNESKSKSKSKSCSFIDYENSASDVHGEDILSITQKRKFNEECVSSAEKDMMEMKGVAGELSSSNRDDPLTEILRDVNPPPVILIPEEKAIDDDEHKDDVFLTDFGCIASVESVEYIEPMDRNEFSRSKRILSELMTDEEDNDDDNGCGNDNEKEPRNKKRKNGDEEGGEFVFDIKESSHASEVDGVSDGWKSGRADEITEAVSVMDGGEGSSTSKFLFII